MAEINEIAIMEPTSISPAPAAGDVDVPRAVQQRHVPPPAGEVRARAQAPHLKAVPPLSGLLWRHDAGPAPGGSHRAPAVKLHCCTSYVLSPPTLPSLRNAVPAVGSDSNSNRKWNRRQNRNRNSESRSEHIRIPTRIWIPDSGSGTGSWTPPGAAGAAPVSVPVAGGGDAAPPHAPHPVAPPRPVLHQGPRAHRMPPPPSPPHGFVTAQSCGVVAYVIQSCGAPPSVSVVWP